MPEALDAEVRQLVVLEATIRATTSETMSPDVKMVRGDTLPSLQFTVKDEDGTVIDITGATGTFRIRRKGEATVLVSRAITVTNGPLGLCTFAWAAADWDAGKIDAAGEYEGELEIVLSGNTGTVFDPYDIYVRNQIA